MYPCRTIVLATHVITRDGVMTQQHRLGTELVFQPAHYSSRFLWAGQVQHSTCGQHRAISLLKVRVQHFFTISKEAKIAIIHNCVEWLVECVKGAFSLTDIR